MAPKIDEQAPTYRRTGVIEHLEGCPATAERQESLVARRPSTGEVVRVDRCCDCGAQTVKVVGAGPRARTTPERDAARRPVT